MNTLLKNLAWVSRDNPFADKKLVVPDYQSGHQLLEALARNGTGWLNIEPLTPGRLAADYAGDILTGPDYRVAEPGELLSITGELLDEMRTKGELKYFSELEGIEGPAATLHGALIELRMAGVEAGSMDAGQFEDPQKGKEIITLLDRYDKSLESKGLADQAWLYLKAIERLKQHDASKFASGAGSLLYLTPEQVVFNFLEYSFIDLLSRGKRLVLQQEPVFGLARSKPPFYFTAQDEKETFSPLSVLYDPGMVAEQKWGSKADSLHIFRAYGTACEIKEVFRRLKESGEGLDGALITYPNSQTYLPLIHAVAESCGSQVTSSEGLPVLLTRSGKFVAGLLRWMEDNYSALHLYRLLSSRCLQVKKNLAMARLLRRAAVSWGRESYPVCLQGLEDELKRDKEVAEGSGKNGKAAFLEDQLGLLCEQQELIDNLMTAIPETDDQGRVDFALLCSGLTELLKDYAPRDTELDRLAGEGLAEMLQQLKMGYNAALPLNKAINLLKHRLNSIKVGASAAKAGCLHAAPIGKAEWVDRPNTYVVGLAGEFFPGSGLQDPVLLDREREKISGNLTPAAARPERNQYVLTRFLASRRGEITLSFPAYDPVSDRPYFPAALVLQVYRLKAGQPGADYSEFLNSLEPPVTYYPLAEEKSLSSAEWWLSLVMTGQENGSLDNVRNCYPGIKAGLEAEEKRAGDLFTEYDGKIVVDPADLDPRADSEKILSASGLEKLAGCPFAYFLERVLYIDHPDEEFFDRWQWLNPKERGLLLHRVYDRYISKVCIGTNSPVHDRSLLFDIAEGEIEKVRKDKTPPSEVVFISEKNQLLKELEVFLRCEQLLWDEGSIPHLLEAPFGMGAEDVKRKGYGLAGPVSITLPGGGEIRIRGKIDRIDRLPKDGDYRIWDYKTGGTYAFRREDYIKRGRQIQHVLYALAAEKILQQVDPQARVKDGGYLFPTEKGEGQGYLRDSSDKGKALDALNLLFDLLAGGIFCVAEDKDAPCFYCDFGAVCRYPQSQNNLKKKIEHTANSDLKPWKELREYE